MLFSPYKMIFLLSLVSGTLLTISSSSWFSEWIGLELNLMSFIPLISSKENQLPSEASLKYFLIQALGSAIIILSSTLTFFMPGFSLSFISLALLLKLGAAPFHFWFPQVMEGLNWTQVVILMTIQKLALMFLISYLSMEPYTYTLLFLGEMTSTIVGALGSINQTSLRKILAYSSINHMSWMLFFAMLINETSWMIYFLMYALISTSVALFSSTQAYFFSHLINSYQLPFPKIISMNFYSLGGLSPFSGFIPKSSNNFNNLLLSSSNPSSLFTSTIYFYIRLTLSSISISYTQMKWNTSYKSLKIFSSPFWSSVNLFGLFTPSMLLAI